MATDKWEFDALKLQMQLLDYLHVERPSRWTNDDAIDLEHYCNAIMQLTRQMDAGQRQSAKDECGTLVNFNDIPQILNQIAVLATHMVLSGHHKMMCDAS